jgi:cytochrome c peroxidase
MMRNKCFVLMILFLGGIAWVVSAKAAKLPNIAQLGKIMFQDLDFSYNSTQACMTCHHHQSGFADPDNALVVPR